MKKVIPILYALALLIFFSFTTSAQTITQLSSIPSISIFDMKYTNNHLVVSQNGLLIYNVSNNSISLQASVAYPGSHAPNVGVDGTRAYLAEGGGGIFAVYNILNLNAPTLTGQLAIPATAFLTVGSIAPRGNYVYMTGIDTLYIINVSNPASPQLAAQVYIPQQGGELGIDGTILYVMTAMSLRVYDISIPTNPVFISSVPNSHVNKGLSVDVVNHRVFLPWITSVSPQYMGHNAYNMSTASSPVFLFSDSTAFGSGDVGVSAYSSTNNVLYMQQFATIKAFDVSANHRFVTSFTGTSVANATVAIDVKDDIFYNARRGGIEVLRFGTASGGTCNTPMGLNAGNITSSSAVLSWTAVSGTLSYNLQWKRASSSSWTTVSGLTTNSYNLTGLSSRKDYHFQVQAVCSSGSSAYSSPASFKTMGSNRSSYTEFTNTAELKLYPNPANDNITFEFANVGNGSIQVVVYNISGQKLINILNPSLKGLNIFNLNISKFGTGIYFLEMENNGHRQLQKFMISR